MLHCDLRVRWKVASDLRFRAAIYEPKSPSFCGISGDLAQSTRKSLAIAIVQFWCAKNTKVHMWRKGSCTTTSGKKKAHKHKFFCPVGPSFHRICPRDKSGEKQGQTQEFFLFYKVEARFHRACPWDKPGLSQGQSRGRRAAQKVYVKKVYVPFSLASTSSLPKFPMG